MTLLMDNFLAWCREELELNKRIVEDIEAGRFAYRFARRRDGNGRYHCQVPGSCQAGGAGNGKSA